MQYEKKYALTPQTRFKGHKVVKHIFTTAAKRKKLGTPYGVKKDGYLLFGGAYTPNDVVFRRLRAADMDPDSARFEVGFVALIYKIHVFDRHKNSRVLVS